MSPAKAPTLVVHPTTKERLSLPQWAKRLGVKYDTLHKRYAAMGPIALEPKEVRDARLRSSEDIAADAALTAQLAEAGITRTAYYQRIRNGWDTEKARTAPPTPRALTVELDGIVATITEHARRLGIARATLYMRFYKNGSARMRRPLPPIDVSTDKRVRVLDVDGVRDTVAGHARKSGLNASTLLRRLDRGIEPTEATTRPTRERKYFDFCGERLSLSEIARSHEVPLTLLYARVVLRGWTAERAVADARHEPARVAYDGQTLTLAEHAARLGIEIGTVRHRFGMGRPLDEVFSVYNLKAEVYVVDGFTTGTLRELAEMRGLEPGTVYARMARNGGSMAQALGIYPPDEPATVFGRRQTLSEWSAEWRITFNELSTWLAAGTTVEKALRLRWRPESDNERRDRLARAELYTWRDETRTIGEWETISGLDLAELKRRIRAGVPDEAMFAPVEPKPRAAEETRGPSKEDSITAGGETKTIAQWAEIAGIPPSRIIERLRTGIEPECAVHKRIPKNALERSMVPYAAAGLSMPLHEWAARTGLSADTLRKRISAGWKPDDVVSLPRISTNRHLIEAYGVPAGQPGSWSWRDLPYERDSHAQAFVEAHDEGATMEEIAEAMGVEVSWVSETQEVALQKLRAALHLGGEHVAPGDDALAKALEAVFNAAPNDGEDFVPDVTSSTNSFVRAWRGDGRASHARKTRNVSPTRFAAGDERWAAADDSTRLAGLEDVLAELDDDVDAEGEDASIAHDPYAAATSWVDVPDLDDDQAMAAGGHAW